MNTVNGCHFDNTKEGLKAWRRNQSQPQASETGRLKPARPHWANLDEILSGQIAYFSLNKDDQKRAIAAIETRFQKHDVIRLHLPAGWAAVTIENITNDEALLEAYKQVATAGPEIYCERAIPCLFSFVFRMPEGVELESGETTLENGTVLRLVTVGGAVPVCGRPIPAPCDASNPGALIIPRENRPGSVAPEAFFEWLDGLTWEVEQC